MISSIPSYAKEALLWRQEKDITATKAHLDFVINAITALDANAFTLETIKAAVWPYAEKVGKGNVLWPMRYSLSGKEKSPDPFIIASLIGKDETLHRLTIARDLIS